MCQGVLTTYVCRVCAKHGRQILVKGGSLNKIMLFIKTYFLNLNGKQDIKIIAKSIAAK